MEEIAFIDLEASGLGPDSWPIEVGWCGLSGTPETFLIETAPDWPQSAWDENAEALHGVSRGELEKKGKPAGEICNALNTALEGRKVLSDAPDWDGFWLYRLFSAAGEKQKFALAGFVEQFPGLSEEEFRRFAQEASKTAPHRHRAAADVLHMRAVYLAINAR